MGDILQTNVFFVITSVAVVLFTILVCIALVYIIRILRNVREMTDRLKRGTEILAEDASAIHSFVQTGIIGTARSFFASTLKKKSRTAGDKKKDPQNDNS